MNKKGIWIFVLIFAADAAMVFAYQDCSVPACPAGYIDNGTVCSGPVCERTCYAISCGGGWNNVYSSSGVYWDLGWEDFKQVSGGSYTATNRSECYKFEFDAAPSGSAYIQVMINNTPPAKDCDPEAIGGYFDGTSTSNPWFANMTFYDYLDVDPGNAKYNYLLKVMRASAEGTTTDDQQYMNNASVDGAIYCANNSVVCEDIANGTANCAVGCYDRGTDISVAQGGFEDVGSNDYNLYGDNFCGNAYVQGNRYGSASEKYLLRVYSIPLNKTVYSNQECYRTNEAPNATNVSVFPSNPTAGNDLYCGHNYSDPEKFIEKDSTYEWWKNGTDQNINSQELDKGNLTPGDVWFCKVTPSDGLLNGSKVQSSNNVPVLGTVQNPTMYINSTLYWNKNGYYGSSEVILVFNNALEMAVGNCSEDAEGYCNVSLVFGSDAVGLLNLTDLEIFYEEVPPPTPSISISSLAVLYSSGTEKIFELVISNDGDLALGNVSWSLNFGDGVAVNSTSNISLDLGEESFVYVAHHYASEGDFVVNATVSSINLSASNTLSVHVGDVVVQSIAALTQNELGAVFELVILSQGSNNITSVNWSFDPGDASEIIYAEQLVDLGSGEDLRVYVKHSYSEYGDYVVTATANTSTTSDSESTSVEIDAVSVSGLSLLNFTAAERIFEFFVANNFGSDLTGVNWTFDTGDNKAINGTQSMVLAPAEAAFVYVQHNYSSAGTFNANVTVRNNTLVDWANLTFSVT